MQRALNFVERKCEREGLSVNPEKISLVPFAKSRQLLEMKVSFFSVVFSRLGEVKYLEVILDSKLTSKPHLQSTTNKAAKTLCACNGTFGSNLGRFLRMIYWIHTMMVIPIIVIAAFVWRLEALIQHCRNKLVRVH